MGICYNNNKKETTNLREFGGCERHWRFGTRAGLKEG